MEELKEVIESGLVLQDKVAVLEFQLDFLKGEMRNCRRIFKHEEMPGYEHYTSRVLEMVGEK